MSVCEELTAGASNGAAPALRAVDCLANDAAAGAFGRLFGGSAAGSGALTPALTILLTLYIAFFAISLLTGRSRIGISALTPRMFTLGLVLTFATSWAAYQSVVWNLAIGAPDQLAAVMTGARGSATSIFADKLDIVFAAIAQAAGTAGGEGSAAQGAAQGALNPKSLVWLAAILLLLGTVGVLVTARIALAVLLAVGPVFVVFALFGGTRGLFAGWLRGLVLTAITPLFVVVGGGIMLELLVPIIAGLGTETGISGQGAMALFLVASVHVALMAMVLKVCGAMVSGWQVFGFAANSGDKSGTSRSGEALPSVPAAEAIQPLASPARGRAAVIIPAPAEQAPAPSTAAAEITIARSMGRAIAPAAGGNPAMLPLPARRARGIGSRFSSRPSQVREMRR